jgi:ribosomal protein S18 acetylase RimI-like enzyme
MYCHQYKKQAQEKKCWKTIITIVKSMGGDVLLLNVNRNNPAKSFYKKLGFTVIKEDDIDIGNGYFMNDYVMKLQLSQVHGDVI